jgi:hypothetical protein
MATHNFIKLRLEHGSPNVLAHSATPIIVGWFAGRIILPGRPRLTDPWFCGSRIHNNGQAGMAKPVAVYKNI